jgi:hypothetical protein
MSIPEPLDAEAQRRLDIVKREVNRHKRIREFGLLTILALLVVVYPLAVFLDGLSINGWRKAQMPGSERAALPTGPIQRIDVDAGAKRLTLSSGGGQVALPIVPAERAASGDTRIETWKPGTMSLGSRYPCIERGTAGLLRALGRPSLYDAHAGRCLRLDGETYDVIFTHATNETVVSFR